ncbi:MAG: Uma2 family endonuclease [Chloroflexi bacterium]|nr:Uma2 family endonuclease [Chloroflexota bacterium]
MRTTFVMDPPPIVEDWLAQRRALGQDRYDEVWEGEYHVSPGPTDRHGDVDYQVVGILGPQARAASLHGRTAGNIGRPGDFRVPDQLYVRDRGGGLWHTTAVIVVEVLSPGDESRHKLGFYFRAGVEEVLLVDPDQRTVEWLMRGRDGFEPADGSAILDISSVDLAAAIDWPI